MGSSPQGVIKINVDGGFSLKEDRHGIGFIARTHEGKVLAAGAKSLWACSSVEEVEARATFWAVQYGIKHGWPNVIIEGDCRCLIEALQVKMSRCFHTQTIVDNCRALSSCLSSLSFLFCYRDSNEVAHRLAKWAKSSACDKVWVDNVPPWLGDALYSDLSFNES